MRRVSDSVSVSSAWPSFCSRLTAGASSFGLAHTLSTGVLMASGSPFRSVIVPRCAEIFRYAGGACPPAGSGTPCREPADARHGPATTSPPTRKTPAPGQPWRQSVSLFAAWFLRRGSLSLDDKTSVASGRTSDNLSLATCSIRPCVAQVLCSICSWPHSMFSASRSRGQFFEFDEQLSRLVLRVNHRERRHRADHGKQGVRPTGRCLSSSASDSLRNSQARRSSARVHCNLILIRAIAFPTRRSGGRWSSGISGMPRTAPARATRCA